LRLKEVPQRIADGTSGIWYNYQSAPDFGLAAPVMKLIENLKVEKNH
jgi:hypothetical protein